jgi:hypothetical protein
MSDPVALDAAGRVGRPIALDGAGSTLRGDRRYLSQMPQQSVTRSGHAGLTTSVRITAYGHPPAI